MEVGMVDERDRVRASRREMIRDRDDSRGRCHTGDQALVILFLLRYNLDIISSSCSQGTIRTLYLHKSHTAQLFRDYSTGKFTMGQS